MMKKPLKVLIIEDSEDDAQILLASLRHSGYEPIFERVQTEKELRSALENQRWDIFLSDYQMPNFLGTDALKIVREKGLDIPFIMITGHLGEERAVEIMRNGANDFFLKGNIQRLAEAVNRELREYEIRKKQREGEIALRQSEERYRKLIDLNPDGILILSEDKIIFANPPALAILGLQRKDEYIDKGLIDFIEKTDLLKYREFIADVNRGQKLGSNKIELSLLRLDKKQIDVEILGTPLVYQNQAVLYLIIRDITERHNADLQIDIQYQVTKIISESETLFSATEKMLKLFSQKLHWDLCQIWAIDTESKQINCVGSYHSEKIKSDIFFEESKKTSRPSEGGIVGTILKSMKTVWIKDLSSDPNFIRKDIATQIGLKTGVGFPITYRNELLGFLEFFSCDFREPDPRILSIFEVLGAQIGSFIKRMFAEGSLTYLSEHEPITGLLNEKAYRNLLEKLLKNRGQEDFKIGIVNINIDNFQTINTTLGGFVGEDIIKLYSDQIQEVVTLEKMMSYYSNGSFFIAFTHLRDINELHSILKVINDLHIKTYNIKNNKINLDISMGVSIFPGDGLTAEELIRNAQNAARNASSSGKNKIVFSSPDIAEKAKKKIVLAAELQEAIKKYEFTLYYQPKIDILTNKVAGAEALLRWERSEGILQPNQFISTLEDTGLILALSEWIFLTACKQAKQWQEMGLPKMTVSVNLSALNFSDPNLIELFKKVLQESNLEPECLDVELTEASFMKDARANILVLNKIAKLGLKLSIDDFGTGYSSFSYLRDMPINNLKIDQSFVFHVSDSLKSAAIVSSIITLGHNLNLKLIAEGVETKDQLDFLKEHKCDQGQGYYFSKPLSQDQFMKWVSEQNSNQ